LLGLQSKLFFVWITPISLDLYYYFSSTIKKDKIAGYLLNKPYFVYIDANKATHGSPNKNFNQFQYKYDITLDINRSSSKQKVKRKFSLRLRSSSTASNDSSSTDSETSPDSPLRSAVSNVINQSNKTYLSPPFEQSLFKKRAMSTRSSPRVKKQASLTEASPSLTLAVGQEQLVRSVTSLGGKRKQFEGISSVTAASTDDERRAEAKRRAE
jgi:hypothetical protein